MNFTDKSMKFELLTQAKTINIKEVKSFNDKLKTT